METSVLHILYHIIKQKEKRQDGDHYRRREKKGFQESREPEAVNRGRGPPHPQPHHIFKFPEWANIIEEQEETPLQPVT